MLYYSYTDKKRVLMQRLRIVTTTMSLGFILWNFIVIGEATPAGIIKGIVSIFFTIGLIKFGKQGPESGSSLTVYSPDVSTNRKVKNGRSTPDVLMIEEDSDDIQSVKG